MTCYCIPDSVCSQGSYKPDLRNFHFVLEKVNQNFGAEKAQVLHVFQSLFHDAVPATAMGMATTHIDRRFGMEGGGATPTPSEPYKLNYYFKTLGEFADAVDAAFASS
jgi:2-haloacid dehalogenase